MELVAVGERPEIDLTHRVMGAAVGVLFADGRELGHLRRAGAGNLPLTGAASICADDTYLVLPDDIGEEIVDIMRDGDHELLHEAMTEGLIVCGSIHHRQGAPALLCAERATAVSEVLAGTLDYAATLSPQVDSLGGALRTINTLPHLQCTMLSALVDEAGLRDMLATGEFLGASWRPPETGALADVAPTFVWSRHTAPGEVGVELALFSEEDDLIALLRPLRLRRAGAA